MLSSLPCLLKFRQIPRTFYITILCCFKNDIKSPILSHACELVNRKARGLSATSHAWATRVCARNWSMRTCCVYPARRCVAVFKPVLARDTSKSLISRRFRLYIATKSVALHLVWGWFSSRNWGSFSKMNGKDKTGASLNQVRRSKLMARFYSFDQQ